MELNNGWTHFRVLPIQEHIFANVNLNYRHREILKLLEMKMSKYVLGLLSRVEKASEMARITRVNPASR